jgi:ubiquitin conjugation factor E4 B
MLSQIFRISVDPHHMTSLQGHRLTFLPNLNEELNEAQEPLKLSVGNLDQAIIEACCNWPLDKPLMGYLLPCWKRAVKAAASARIASATKIEVHEESKRLCMSNTFFALTMPALFK